MPTVPGNIANYRREICMRCTSPCQYQQDDAFRLNADSECPREWEQRWYKFVTRMRGAGDFIHRAISPVVNAIDIVAGTNIKGCGGCAKRREMLNSAIPFK